MKKTLVILSGEIMERDDLGLFAIDPDSIVLHKDKLVVDFNHDEELILGYIENIRSEGGKLLGDATLESVVEGDKAQEIIARIEGGVPFEVSPTVMLHELGVVKEQATVDDKEYTIYRQVPLRGVSVCVYGTDRLTTLLTLDGGTSPMKKRNKRLTKMAADEINEAVETAVVDEGGEGEFTAYPLLEEFIELFGFERGVNFYRRGLTKEEAEAEDYADLKAQRLAAEIDDAGAITDVDQVDDAESEAAEKEAEVEEAQDKVDAEIEKELNQNTGLKANIALTRAVKALAQEMVKLKAVSVRGGTAVESTQRKEPVLDAVHKYARKISKR